MCCTDFFSIKNGFLVFRAKFGWKMIQPPIVAHRIVGYKLEYTGNENGLSYRHQSKCAILQREPIKRLCATCYSLTCRCSFVRLSPPQSFALRGQHDGKFRENSGCFIGSVVLPLVGIPCTTQALPPTTERFCLAAWLNTGSKGHEHGREDERW